jgi:hypothetical protein
MEGSDRFDEGATTAPLNRETPYASQQQQPRVGDQGYGYGPPQQYGHGFGRRGGPRMGASFGGGARRPIETRPFFLTSEFIGTVLTIAALGITAGVMDIVNARMTWILTAALVVGYVISRGLAKAGSRSHSFDPRAELLQRGLGDGQQQHQHQQQQWVGRPETGYSRPRGFRQPGETTPFFLTSEFVGTLLAVLAVALTAAAMDNLNARLTWIVIASLVATYAVSRGLAKSGTESYAFDPREDLLRRGDSSGEQQQVPQVEGMRGMQAVETKPFFVTSEFLVTLLAIVAIAISAASLDNLDVRLTWILIAVMVGGYVVSRGIAKVGVKSHVSDPRELLLARTASAGNDRHAVTQR